MATIYPFRALRPRQENAERVASVPYDVVNRSEARVMAEGNPYSFLHVTKPEIDLDEGVDPYSEEVYAGGGRALRDLQEQGIMRQDDQPALYVYALTMQGQTQTGIVLCASVAEYQENLVRKHEFTRPDKENDRVRHMEAAGAQTGTVFLVHRDSELIAQQIGEITRDPAEVDFTALDGIRHQTWCITDPQRIQILVQGFAELGPIYIADGHHRSAAAGRVLGGKRAGAPRDAINDGFLAVSFPTREMRILPYNRLVKDLNGYSSAAFLEAVAERFELKEGKPDPIHAKQFGMYLEGQWHTLNVKQGSYNAEDPTARLDVSILQEQLLAPLLGIGDPRRDQRIDFVGGIRGDDELAHRVSEGWAVAFKMHPTSIEDLLAIADAEQVMPPKSTWFEPKLRDGLFVHLLT